MEFAIATISTKGQLVIPADLRRDLKEGDQVLIVRDEDRFVIKKMEDVAKDIQDDLLFAKRADEAYDRLLTSKNQGLTMKDFLAEASKW
jgi:AbrB family looped-hinge helix DNA binding protein